MILIACTVYVYAARRTSLLARPAARWLNAPLNRVSLRIRSSRRFPCQVLILGRVRCHLLVEKNLRGMPFDRNFDRNFIVICLSAEVRGRLPFGTNFVVVCFLFRARGNVLLKKWTSRSATLRNFGTSSRAGDFFRRAGNNERRVGHHMTTETRRKSSLPRNPYMRCI